MISPFFQREEPSTSDPAFLKGEHLLGRFGVIKDKVHCS
jgi:hypothetical protein